MTDKKKYRERQIKMETLEQIGTEVPIALTRLEVIKPEVKIPRKAVTGAKKLRKVVMGAGKPRKVAMVSTRRPASLLLLAFLSLLVSLLFLTSLLSRQAFFWFLINASGISFLFSVLYFFFKKLFALSLLSLAVVTASSIFLLSPKSKSQDFLQSFPSKS